MTAYQGALVVSVDLMCRLSNHMDCLYRTFIWRLAFQARMRSAHIVPIDSSTWSTPHQTIIARLAIIH